MRNLRLLDIYRNRAPEVVKYYGNEGDETCGAFMVPSPVDRAQLCIIASSGIKWADVAGYEGIYQVSNDGRVRALPKVVELPNGGRREHDLAELSYSLEHGYRRVTLCKNGDREKPFVHVLVARAFIPNPHNYPEVNHRDFDKMNARVTNLEWCTGEYNRHHAIEGGIRNGLRLETIEQIKLLLDSGLAPPEIAAKFDVGNDAVNKVQRGWIRNTNPDPPSPYPGPNPFWDHVSVSRTNRCPNWPEMEHIKRLFFKDDETAMQLHVAVADHISHHPYCLHIWRPHDVPIPLPPKEFVA